MTVHLSPVERLGMRASYAARQVGRVAWYAGHGALVRNIVARIDASHPDGPLRLPPPSVPVPGMGRLLADVGALMRQDLANIEAGLYPMPDDEDPSDLVRALRTSRLFLEDVPEVQRRRRAGAGQEVAKAAREEDKRPRYFLQNFHFQSGGWMTEDSADIYDMQVEVLFSGAASAMRRQALAPIAEHVRGRDQRTLRFADVACGTGQFLAQARSAFPRLPAFGVDLSEAYVAHTARRMGRRPLFQPLVGKAEALPFPTGALDVLSTVYLFHELPPKVRRQAAAEFARVVKPGGLLVFVDSLQRGDEPDYDGLLDLFPQMFHEPYYAGYAAQDLVALFGEVGFTRTSATNAFFSKVAAFRRG